MADPQLVIRVAANLDALRTNLAEGVNQIEVTSQALTKMAASYDGSKTIQQANATAAAIQQIGGVTNLTAAEATKANVVLQAAIDKYDLLGRTAPAGMRELAQQTKDASDQTSSLADMSTRLVERFLEYQTIREAINFSKELIEDAAKLENLSVATGISTDALQRLAYVGRDANIDIDTLGRAIEQFSAKLAGGDANATKAVEMLGLSVNDLVKAGPLDAFVQFTAAATRVQDPMLKNAILADAFGGRLAKLIASIKDFSQAINDVPKTALIDDSSLKQLKSYDDMLGHVYIALKAWATDALVGLVDSQKAMYGGLAAVTQATDDHTKAAGDNKAALDDMAKSEQGTTSTADVLANRLKALRDDALVPLTQSQKDAIVQLESFGVSHKEIAQLVQTTEIAVKLYTEVVKQSAEEQKQSAALIAKQIEETTRLYDTYYKAVNAASHNTTAAQVNDVWLAADAHIAAMEKAKTITVEDYGIIWATAQQTADNIIQKSLESDKYTREHYQLLADQAKIAYDFALEHASSYTNQEIQMFAEAYRTNTQASMHWVAQASDDMDAVAKKGKATAQAIADINVPFDSFGNLLGDLAKKIQVTDQATVGWNASIMATHSMADAVNMDLTAQIKNVQTLAGEYITAADAKKRFDQGGSMDVTSQNLATALDQTITASYGSPGSGIYSEHGLIGKENQASDLASKGYSFAEIVAFLEGGTLAKTPIGPRIPGYLDGGPTVAGPAILHDGEYVVPKDGALVSSGGGGSAQPQIIQLVVDRRVLASVYSTQATRDMKQTRQYPAP